MLIDIDADTVVTLAPHLKDAQLDAMSNGDEYVPILPDFEVYRTRLTHSRTPSQVMTEVLGIKSAPQDAKLLSKFFTRLAAEKSNDHHDGTFLPKGAVHLLGMQTYEQVLKENNFFLTQVATIPVNLEYEAWFALIDPHTTSDSDPLSLHEHLLRKPWFLRIESVSRQKCNIVTTQPNLPEARAWIDAYLEPLIQQSIPLGIDPPSSSLPRRLDKLVYSSASQSYADVLKQQFSLTSNQATTATDNNRPPRKRPATIIDYDSDQSVELPPSTPMITQTISNSCTTTQTMTSTATAPNDYTAELLALKQEIAQLKSTILTAVEQITTAIASFHATKSPPVSQMDTDMETTTATTLNIPTNHPPTQLDLPAIISELKNEIATINNETRTMFQQYLPPKSTSTTNSSPAT